MIMSNGPSPSAHPKLHINVQIMRNGRALLPHELGVLVQELKAAVGNPENARASLELAEACMHNMTCKQVASLHPTWSDEQIYRGVLRCSVCVVDVFISLDVVRYTAL